jgi:uncharacterized membrane protein YkvA (DUF1232 family)
LAVVTRPNPVRCDKSRRVVSAGPSRRLLCVRSASRASGTITAGGLERGKSTGRSSWTQELAQKEGFKDYRMAGTLKDWARIIKRDAHALYLAARDPRTPWYAKALAICVAGYALSPIDLIPDFVPVLGYLDDVIILPLGIWAVVKLIPPQITTASRAAAGRAADRPVSRSAALVIALIWTASIALAGWLGYRHFAGGNSN